VGTSRTPDLPNQGSALCEHNESYIIVGIDLYSAKINEGGARQGAGRKKESGQAAHYRAMLEPYAEELIQRVVGNLGEI
jgi:hypothetical protein